MRKFALGLAALAASAVTATPAQAALVLVGEFSGTDCSGEGGFSNCYATQDGVVQGGGVGSPTVYKLNEEGGVDISSLWPSIDGSEFDITYIPTTLSFTYTPGVDDPELHYFSIKQANGYLLFYDENPITSASIDLSDYDLNGWSHITFFDTGAPGVPEPATWAMLLIGFGAIGATMRAKKKTGTGRRLRLA